MSALAQRLNSTSPHPPPILYRNRRLRKRFGRRMTMQLPATEQPTVEMNWDPDIPDFRRERIQQYGTANIMDQGWAVMFFLSRAGKKAQTRFIAGLGLGGDSMVRAGE
ncbi:hypothetical protein EX30DRAFT_4579 [Ascodesmis nigricans]|uniref:Uncharacterized protein n=1 Tax=Ascodesmis nigricans TaxID=341454 RepID=A0A4S2N5Q0_9PEZI|nr:hypothetical protein EX30DRAFT_4579 [Ascodesmis nigricans]